MKCENKIGHAISQAMYKNSGDDSANPSDVAKLLNRQNAYNRSDDDGILRNKTCHPDARK